MKIAMTGNVYPFGDGLYYGGERVIHYLIKALSDRHDIYLFSCRGTNVPEVKEYVEVPVICEEDVHAKAIREYQHRTGIEFDVYHCNYFGEGFDQALLSDYNYCELVWCNWSHVNQNVVSYSNLLQKDMKESGRPSSMIHYGIPEEYPFSLEHDDYAVWIGKIEEGKGADLAIDIALRAGMRIVIMGNPYDVNYFTQKVAPRIDNDKVIWLRGVNDVIKSKVFQRAKAFISTNTTGWTEYFGIVNIESLAHGVPVIAFSSTQHPSAIAYDEIIEEADQGFFVHYNDTEQEREQLIDYSVARIAEIDKIDRMSCRRRFEEKFTSGLMASRWEYVYEQIQGGNKFEVLEIPF